jgi:hypothetical protein
MTPIPQLRTAPIEHNLFCNYLCILVSILLMCHYTLLISEVPLLVGGEVAALDSPSDWKNVLRNGRRLLLDFSFFARFFIFLF